ncbi:MAG TPA: S-methyl-5'-thioadenosine phosphorylase [Actinomycetota bacterium]|nr:S-methyl-5'-thioadenosine phosphorylase [Actinomycetota bacterium]
MTTAEVGVFGGSGFYSFLEDVEEVEVDTPYGAPSAPLVVGEIEGRRVAFLARHGPKHHLPPHKVPYRANVWAMKELGVGRIVGPCAAGSLQSAVKPGHFVICDQLVERTWGRQDTFYDGPETTHIGFADPYCPTMREAAIKQGRDLGIELHERGTVVVVQGPRFSTRAESDFFRGQGWEVINMTQYPESVLARELEICYLNVSLITDYDVGVEGEDVEPVSHERVIQVFSENISRLRDLLFRVIPALPEERTCPCATALQGARFEVI